MLRFPGLLLAALLVASASPAEILPRPAGLEPNVRFWARIYSEVDTHGGLIHDTEHLDVVYEEIAFPQGLSWRAREHKVEAAKSRIRAALRALGQGRRSGLGETEARVLSRWPQGVSNATLRAAAGRVRFQLGQADKFRDGLIRAGAWRGYIESTLTERGLPNELVALPHVESSYNPTAYSRVGAAGLWQFTRSTGVRYLRVDHVVDERMDPYRATVAAARLLSDNYDKLGAWPLAITAYNHGAAGLMRAVRQLGTRDIAEISRRYRSRSFGFASRNFYAEFLAALEVDRNADALFGALHPDPPQSYHVVALEHYYQAASLARALGLSGEELRRHNPALRPSVWTGAKHVPRGYELRVPRAALQGPVQVALASVPPGERFAEQHRDKYHTVRRGDTLSTIAGRYGVGVSQLVAVNNLRSRHTIRVGQVLVLPDDARGTSVQVARQEPPVDGRYTVRRGDNLTVIAARFGVSPTELARENGLRNRNVLRVGQRLRLPGAPEVVAATAPAEPEPIQVASAVAPADPEGGGERAVTPSEPLAEVAPHEPAPAPPETGHPAPAEPAPRPEPVAPPELAVDDAAAPPEVAVQDAAPADALEVTVLEGAAGSETDPAGAPDEAPEAGLEAAGVPPEEPEPVLAGEALGSVQVTHAPPPVVVEATESPAVSGTRARNGHPSPDPSNYSVSANQRVVVQAEETLGHYAEWLELRASHLRRINGLRYDAPVVIGRSIRLDFSRVTPELFEQRRLAYHHDLQEEFFSSYEVVGTRTHKLRPGESLWFLAERKFQLPVWLLRQYNPDLDFAELSAGTEMVIPEVEPRGSS